MEFEICPLAFLKSSAKINGRSMAIPSLLCHENKSKGIFGFSACHRLKKFMAQFARTHTFDLAITISLKLGYLLITSIVCCRISANPKNYLANQKFAQIAQITIWNGHRKLPHPLHLDFVKVCPAV